MRIAIIDDERPARSELKYQINLLSGIDCEIVEGDSGAVALELAAEYQFDLWFLDINLGDINGTKLVQAIKRMQSDTKIVFVTAYSQYAVEAFELGVDDYVMKPFEQKRVEKVFHKLFSEKKDKSGQKSKHKIGINISGKTVFEEIEDIVYIESHNRKCKIHVAEKEYIDARTISEMENLLDDKLFYRVHKSYLINLKKVKEIFSWSANNVCVRLNGYENIPISVSREKVKELKCRMEQI